MGVVGEALANQVLALRRHSSVKVGSGATNLLIILKGDVTADHVVEEDAERPNCSSKAVVQGGRDPFWGRVYASS